MKRIFIQHPEEIDVFFYTRMDGAWCWRTAGRLVSDGNYGQRLAPPLGLRSEGFESKDQALADASRVLEKDADGKYRTLNWFTDAYELAQCGIRNDPENSRVDHDQQAGSGAPEGDASEA